MGAGGTDGDDGGRTGRDGYDGHVAVGGPPQQRITAALSITKVAVGPLHNNAYILQCRSTGDLALVDAAAEPDVLLTVLNAFSDSSRLRTIVTTHQHWDHWQALPEVVAATGATVMAHPLDAGPLPVAVVPAEAGSTVVVGEVQLEVIHLVGHTPGSIALLHDGDDRPHLFTGDSLFPGGPGNTEKDPVRFASLMDDLEGKVFGRLADETWVYPGHGADTTLGAERPHVQEWRARGW
jgi:glyoxylase-like metal-dependent hydrolase (beta-lactamase superfamily II)